MMIGAVVMMFVTAPRLATTWSDPGDSDGGDFLLLQPDGTGLPGCAGGLDRLNTVLQENIAGAELIKSFVRDAHEEARFEDTNQDFTASSIR